MNEHARKAMMAMLAIQRYPWEQGVCAQALYEAGEKTYIAMAHDAMLRQRPDGRLAVPGENYAVTDPAANGEALLRAYEETGNPLYKAAADKMYRYLKDAAPKTESGILFHNEKSFDKKFSADQFWVDSCYMAPPFLAAMGDIKEAVHQLNGYLCYLRDPDTGLLYHIYDYGTKTFVRKLLWATGNGWALMGIARMRALAAENACPADADRLQLTAENLLDSMLRYQRPDGLFHDILNDPSSFIDGASAMMVACVIFRGIYEGWLDISHRERAEIAYQTMLTKFDETGLLHDVCGCPHFNSPGTSAEAQASFILMQAWREKLNNA